MTSPSSNSKRPYVSSDGNVLERPPLTARISRSLDDIYNFLGLYFVSLLSLDPYTAAQNSQFNTRGRPNAYQDRPRWGGAGVNGRNTGSGSGGGFGRPGGQGGSGGPRRHMGTVDDVRSPECGSCG